MPEKRFVVLEHHWDGIHYDFMIEAGPVLRTWKLDQPPQAGEPQIVTASFDHRPIYLDYEGPISGDRGHVVRWDSGTYHEEPAAGGALRLQVEGERLCGLVGLRPLPDGRWQWAYFHQTGRDSGA